MLYKNISNSVKTFYGVEFKPGDIKEVPGYINHRKMIAADASELRPPIKQPKTLSEKPKKSSDKTSVTPEAITEEKVDDKSNDAQSSSSKD